ncbi:Dihydrofolate reductase [compost metagenome]
MIIGGSEIYKMMLPYADKLLVTRIDHDFAGDTKFPEVNWTEWKEISEVPGIRDEQNPYDYRFCVYERTV